MSHVDYVGLSEVAIDDVVRRRVKRLVEEYGHRFDYLVNNEWHLVVHVRSHSDTGERHRFSIRGRITFAGRTIATDRANDWDIITAIRMALDNLVLMIERQFKVVERRSFAET